jgi:hypothetical protein
MKVSRFGIPMVESEDIVPAKEIQKAIKKACAAAVKKGYEKPEFHITRERDILGDSSEGRGISWGGDYADFDDGGLGSQIHRGDKVCLQFLPMDPETHDTEISGEVLLDTKDMSVKTEYYSGQG